VHITCLSGRARRVSEHRYRCNSGPQRHLPPGNLSAGSHVAAAAVRTLLACTAMLCAAGCSSSGLTPVPGTHATGLPNPSLANVVQLSSDIFSNPSSQHATEVEPAAAAYGTTIVTAFQAGRFFVAGASDIAYATSQDGGLTWVHGVLPGTTSQTMPAGVFDSVSDPAVAYDAAHRVWLIASLPVLFSQRAAGAAVLISRSEDGITWSMPVSIGIGVSSSDKDWIACDDGPGSPYFGHCYVEWDDVNAGGLIHMNTSTDGGLTWGSSLPTAGMATGIGGQPVVRPDGTVVVPIASYGETALLAFSSHDGGTSWGAPVEVSSIIDHFEAGGLRSGPLPAAAVDAAGTVYVVWQDCRFRINCAANDILMSTSTDGTTWSPPQRIPIDATTSGIDHFLPGIGVAAGTAGATAQIGLTYYQYRNSSCAPASCLLSVGFIGSNTGGASWTTPVVVAGPMSVLWLPQTTLGAMVGDYSAAVFAGGHPYAIAAVAENPVGEFHEAMFATRPGFLSLTGAAHGEGRERPVPGAHPDHPPRPPLPPLGN
jgi:hypothetical protein